MLKGQKIDSQTSRFGSDKDLLERIRFFYQKEDYDLGTTLRDELVRLRRSRLRSEQNSKEFCEVLTENIEHISNVLAERGVERCAWRKVPVSQAALAVPGMLDEDTMRYYSWLGSNYSGAGEVVQLGCWMGRSTVCLAETLSKNPWFAGRRLQVFDSFRWESWMRRYLVDEPELRSAFKAGKCFLDLFCHYCGAFKRFVRPHKQLLNTDGERTHIPPLTWKTRPVELLFYDFGQEYEAIESAWKLFAPSFIPGKTVFVVQPYGNPHAEMLRRFCRDHASQLRPLHKPFSATKGFGFINHAPAGKECPRAAGFLRSC